MWSYLFGTKHKKSALLPRDAEQSHKIFDLLYKKIFYLIKLRGKDGYKS